MKKHTPTELYLIDGYNVIHKIPEIKSLMKTNMQSARERFVLLLTNYFSNKRTEVMVVFDGLSDIPDFNIHSNPKVKVLFSKRNQKADILIKSITDERSNKSLITIVSSDHEVYQYGKVSRCNVMKSEEFIKKTRAKSFNYEHSIKTHILSQDEIELWKQIFNKKGN